MVDALVLSVVHRRVIQVGEFVKDEASGGVRLRDEARRVFLRELERRFLTLFTYEMSGERVSYRRGLILQAQQLARAIASPDLPYIPVRMA